MRIRLTVALLLASLGGCAIVPIGYDDGYYHRHYRDRDYYGERHYRSDDYRRDWSPRGGWWRDDDRGRYSSGSIYYRNWDHGQ